MIETAFLPEPDLEFGFSGRHQEQRAGVMLHGPADIELASRPTTLRLGMVGQRKDLDSLQSWLEHCANGVQAREDTPLNTLFPAFPGLGSDATFRVELDFPHEGQRELTRKHLRGLEDLSSEAIAITAAAELIAGEVSVLLENADVDVVLIARPPKVPDGTATGRGTVGLNFHDVLKARCISARVPIQVIRPRTWTGGRGVEDEATRAWNLLTALYYKCGGKPWRLPRERNQRTRCFIGISFARAEEGNELLTSVAQVFNELGDGVIVRGALARRSGHDKQPHLNETDATALLASALERYREHHGNQPADITLHKTSSFSDQERRGFLKAAEKAELHSCDLVWLTDSEDAFLIRGSSRYPPMRGTLLMLDNNDHALYTHGSVPYYKTYPGMYVPRPVGIRPCDTDRSIENIASEILALSKLNWNRARLDARKPITLLTATRVGEVLRHVPQETQPAARYAFYM
jgi:hypothetical protein